MNYDFIEIGASDFDTQIEICDENTIGLTFEPIQMYLDNLPNKKNVKKVNCAVSNCDREADVFFITPENIEKYDLPWFIRGCNTIDKPHPATKGHHFYLNIPEEIIEKQTIKVKSFKTIVEEFEVESIKLLKIDTEGHDSVILSHYIDLCEASPNLFADRIVFETNWLANMEHIWDSIHRLLNHGYLAESSGENTTFIKG